MSSVFDDAVGTAAASTKEQIVLTAERLFAERGLNGVSLRQLGVAAGNGNNSAVQYHFGSKMALVATIVDYRLAGIERRRAELMSKARDNELRSIVECFVLPLLEQAERDGSHYMRFIATLRHHDNPKLFDEMTTEVQSSAGVLRDGIGRLLPSIPEPLRSHRIRAAIAFAVQSAADRERARASGTRLLPFAVHANELLDVLVGLLQAPISEPTRQSMARRPTARPSNTPSARRTRT